MTRYMQNKVGKNQNANKICPQLSAKQKLKE